MNFFTFDLRKAFILVALIVIPFTAINMEHKAGEKPLYVTPFVFLTGLIQNAYSSFSSGVRGTTSLYFNLVEIKKNNRVLVQENSELRAKLGDLTELKLENERLNKLLSFAQKSKMNLVAAKVIGKDLLPNHDTITINRGTQHGVEEFMAAITTGGVVGYVIQPQLLTAQVLLLTDRYASIDSIVQRSRARGVLEGVESHICRLSYLQREDDVREGDLIVTSGLDDIFPKGFPVGVVTSVEKNDYDISQEVMVKPAINPFSLEEIFIILKSNNESYLKSESEVEDDSQNNASQEKAIQ